jgi:hypothetical protein
MSKPAALPFRPAHRTGGGALSVWLVVVVGALLLVIATLLLVRSAPSDAIDGLTAPAALVGRTT